MTGITVEQVLQVLQVFFFPNGDNVSKKDADSWLDNFQKTSAAWTIGDQLLRTDTLPLEVRIFAAQTMRQKIEFDLDQLDVTARQSLRDSLLTLLHHYRAGPKPMVTQLCLSLADLAIQMVEWEDPIQHLITMFGKEGEMVGPLLEFLGVLPEECGYNKKIQMDEDELISRADKILHEHANEVLSLLLYYHGHAASNIEIQEHILRCLYSWIKSGDIKIASLAGTPVVGMAFDALACEPLFDVASDLACEVIYRSGKDGKEESIIHAVYPRLLPLRKKLEDSKDDPETVRGLCRIFEDAGEAWTGLIATNYEAFEHVVGGLLQCAAYEELDIAKITFLFWEYLANEIILAANAAHRPKFYPVYRQLIDIMIKHLHYPNDLAEWTAEERDEFREFRHEMGDVLKQCVKVLGEEEALSRPYSMLSALCVAGSNGAFDPSVQWQKIEAPLFSLRTMCREVSQNESQVLPRIMEMLPQLPDHAKIKYAAILVIGRYAEWTARHPEFISYQLTFVSKGFEEDEAVAAAAQAMKYLCKACAPQLVNYLNQLHLFYFNIVKKLKREQTYDLTEAIAHVLAAVPVSESLTAMQTFCHPIAQRLHEIASTDRNASDGDDTPIVTEAVAFLDQLGTLIKFVKPPHNHPLSQPFPAASVMQEIWPVIDMLMNKYGSISVVADAFARCCSYTMMSYKWDIVPILMQMMTRTVALFDQTGLACYLWVSWRCVRVYGNDEREEGKTVFGIVETLTASTFRMIQSSADKLENIPDVIEEYFRLVEELLEQCPTLFCQSSLLPSLFNCAMACLAIQQLEALSAVISFLKSLFKCASPRNRTNSLPQTMVDPLIHVIRTNVVQFVQLVFNGLLYTFPRAREVFADVATIFKYMLDAVPDDGARAIEAVIKSFPDGQLSAKDKEEFLQRFASANSDFDDEKKLSGVLKDFTAMFRRRNLISGRGRAH
ncbi:hypothetical protein SpCBS45565_g02000 [Spizellomyces sp. 'palustris']|nr:hypothetical protein SpCBS45565_g02000 [Spizellomyces sp. 'palustris']